MSTLEGRISRLEGLFEQFADRMNGLAARDEMWATKDELRAEMRATKERLLGEIKASELRIIKWLVGSMLALAGLMVAVAGVAVALLKLLP